MRIRYSRVLSLVRRERDDAPASRFCGGFCVGSGIGLTGGSRIGIGWRFRHGVGAYLG
jgi:hypothetical protein